MDKPIVVPLDGSELAEEALAHAAALARLFDVGLILVRVPETMIVPVASGGVWITREIEPHEAQERAANYLAQVASREELAGLKVSTQSPHHPVAEGIIEAARASRAGLVVMTTHGHSGLGRWVYGSVADKLIHATPTPVYIVRAGHGRGGPAFRRVIVPLDGSELGELALPPAIELARAAGGSLALVRVPTLPGYATAIPETAGWIPDLLRETALEAEGYLGRQLERLAGGGVKVSADVEMVVSGGVAAGILSYVEERSADVIVMSTHGRSGLSRWVFGSVADRVLRAATVPVWLVRAQAAREIA